MGDCFICKKPLIEDIYMAKKRAVQTLLAASVKRGRLEDQRILENLDSVSVHGACYKKYGNERLASYASRRSASTSEEPELEPEPESEEQPQLIPDFDFENQCLFCGKNFCDEIKLPAHRRKKIRSLQERSAKESILQYLSGRNDEYALSIVERIQYIPDLVAVGARYHGGCITHVYHSPPVEGIKKGRPLGNRIDEAMEGIYDFLTENSEECQFSMNELMEQLKGDFVPDIRTVKKLLRMKYGDDILINDKQGRDCVVCFRNTGFKILSEKWYGEKKRIFMRKD